MKRHTKLLIGFLLAFVASVNCEYRGYERKDEPLIVCNKTGPCSCYKDTSSLYCYGELEQWHGYKPNPLNYIQTPSSDFFPIKVNLSSNYLGQFKEEKFLTPEQRNKIEILDLSSNSLGGYYSRNVTFNSFANLKVLNLSYNSFRGRSYSDYDTIPSWLQGNPIKTLEVLDLSNNQISNIPTDLAQKFPNLKKLIVSGNSFDYIFAVSNLEGFKYLEELEMNNCNIRQFSYNAYYDKIFPSIRKVSMRNNQFSSFPSMNLFTNLTFLDLGNNYISDIYDYDTHLKKLETLLLDHNNLKSIEFAFSGLKNLKTLGLSYNYGLNYLNGNAFGVKYSGNADKLKLEVLDLSHCDLSTLDQEMLNWSKLKSLKLEKNSFNCDKSLKWLILDHSISIDKNATCLRPAVFFGKHLHEIKAEDINNLMETSILYYIKNALDYVTRDQPLFFFVSGAVCACLLVFFLRCCYCCLCCCCRRCINTTPMFKQPQQYDRLHLIEHEGAPVNKTPEEDTLTIVETIPDE